MSAKSVIRAIIELVIVVLVVPPVRLLAIDNQLTVIRNDCYERLAIGEKLRSRDVYKTLTAKEVQECQLSCTEEHEECRSFSFGLGVKGNGTCELSRKTIRETPDLKPIGTEKNVDYDLYIKKLGCKLVVPKEHPPAPPLPEKPKEPKPYPIRPVDTYGPPDYHDYRKRPYYGPGFHDRDFYDGPVFDDKKPIRVTSSLIGVASGAPSKPPEDNNDDYKRYGTGKPYYPNRFGRPDYEYPPSKYFPDDRPPFRPAFLHHPYHYPPSYKYWYDRDYNRFNDRFDPNVYESRPRRPEYIPERPGYIPDRPALYDYGLRPGSRPDLIPERPYNESIRPHAIPEYGRPTRPAFMPERPYDPLRPIRPYDYDSSRPQRPSYGSEPRPKPNAVPDRPSYGSEPQPKPTSVPERPLHEPQGPSKPDEVPERPDKKPEGGASDESKPSISNRYQPNANDPSGPKPPQTHNQRPYRPSDDDRYRPRPPRPRPPRPGYGYGLQPYRPNIIPERPLGDRDDYDRPYRPYRPFRYDYDRPYRPDDFDSYSSRPFRPDRLPERPINEYGSRPIRPNEIPERPVDDGFYGSRPYRPPYRPTDDDMYSSRPTRPDRPVDDDFYSSKPSRPSKIPARPIDDDFYDSRPHTQDRPTGNHIHTSLPLPVRPNEVPGIPLYDRYGPSSDVTERPIDDRNYDTRPLRPDRVPNRPDGYGSRPIRPNEIPDRPDEYGSRPIRPNEIPDRPDGYGSRPIRPNQIPDRPDGYGSRPIRPNEIPDRPDGYGSRPIRPNEISDRPNEYGSRPIRPNEIPDRPDGYGSRPIRPNEIPDRPDGYGSRPIRPNEIPDRPDGYGSRPIRPNEIPDRPDGYGSRPIRPNEIPDRPDGYGSRPIRPNEIPDRPLLDDIYDRRRKPPPDRPNFDDYGGLKIYGPDRPHDSFYDDIFYRYGPRPFRPFAIRRPDYRRPFYKPTNPADSNESDKPELSTRIGLEPQDNITISLNFTSREAPGNQTTNSSATGGNTTANATLGNAANATSHVGPETCFRRVLAGKRVIRELVRTAVPCERVEDCQRECNDERRFVCEGFNYRLDPSGRSQGDCELLDLPISRLDIRRDVEDDPHYDYYERDRNSDAPDCKDQKYYGSASGGHHYADDRYDYHDNHRNDYYDGYEYRKPYDDDYRPYRRGEYDRTDYDYNYHNSYDFEDKYWKPLPPPPEDYEYKPPYPPPPYDYKSYEPYLPHGFWKYERPYYDSGEYWRKYFEERQRDRNYWGLKQHQDWGSYGGSYGDFGVPDSYPNRNNNRNDYYEKKYFYVPPINGGTSKDWGRYGGSYGSGGHQHKGGYDYWGFDRFDDKPGGYNDQGLLPPYQERPEVNGPYLPPYQDGDVGFHYDHDHFKHGQPHRDYNYYKDECSLRMVTGFRLHRVIVKKLVPVANIYECELLCFKEGDFPCNSYAFRYTKLPNSPPENCYLSDRAYKELDYYEHLEPDRDCDVYTMNSQRTCDQSSNLEKYNSDCFWRVRSGQRLDQRIVRDSLTVKSIADCQLVCLRAALFTCRAFSFRYGSSVIGGAIDNCQLTDWPYLDMNPRVHLAPEDGFELYERGSYGHGCEPNHFKIGAGGAMVVPDPGVKLDNMCYVGYGSPARLLSQPTKKSLRVETEAECKAECSQAREKSLFQCMSLSYQTSSPKGSPNCDLSDIFQRDLLSNVDYTADPDSWLFAWDMHNPRCLAAVNVIGIGSPAGSDLGGTTGWGPGGTVAGSGSHQPPPPPPDHGKGVLIPWLNPGYTWRIYSVGGMPCRKGSLCKENTVAGFWYCELEGKEEHSWDYCCRPDHQCGYSEGFPYQWCYVGPGRSQWRKCNDKYYPYPNKHDRFDQHHPGSYLPDHPWSNTIGSNHIPDFKPLYRPGFRPDRPPPYLPDEYDNQYLDPPKPGGFGPSRHWPLSYLHKEPPPNSNYTEAENATKAPKGRKIDSNYDAIANLISVIKSSDKEAQYSFNSSSKPDDAAYFRIPIPSNLTSELKSEKMVKLNETEIKLEAIDILPKNANLESSPRNQTSVRSATGRRPRMYTRGYVTKTSRPASNQKLVKSANGS